MCTQKQKWRETLLIFIFTNPRNRPGGEMLEGEEMCFGVRQVMGSKRFSEYLKIVRTFCFNNGKCTPCTCARGPQYACVCTGVLFPYTNAISIHWISFTSSTRRRGM